MRPQNAVARLAGKIFVLALPFVIVLAMLASLSVYIGEAMPLTEVVALQSSSTPMLWGPDNNIPFSYKLASVNLRRPDVITVGSSRTLHFRSGLLTKQPESFFNAGGQGWRVKTMLEFLRRIDPEALPRIVIVGIDQPELNGDYTDDSPERGLEELTATEMNRVLFGTHKVSQYLFTGQLRPEHFNNRVEPLNGIPARGLAAIFQGRGFRNDGSLQISAEYADLSIMARSREQSLQVFSEPPKDRTYAHGTHVSEATLDDIEAMLRYAQEHSTLIVGFMPPYMAAIVDQMIDNPDFAYMPASIARTGDLFRQYDMPFFDFTDPRLIGGSDAEMRDGWHSSELLDVRIFLAMVETYPELFAEYADAQALREIITTSQNPFDVFGPGS